MIWSAITNVIGNVAGTYMETRQIKAAAKAKASNYVTAP